MDLNRLKRLSESEWMIEPAGDMRVPGVIYASRELVMAMDEKVYSQVRNVATLPGIVKASYAMPDAHWGYGFPIGGVAAFDPVGGVISAGGVGFDISCGVRMLHTGLTPEQVRSHQEALAKTLFREIPAGLGSTGALHLSTREMDAMLAGGARWAVEQGYGEAADLERIEEHGCMQGAKPDAVSDFAKRRQQNEMGTLGSGNHYLEMQRVTHIYDEEAARAFGIGLDDIKISIHCGSRGLGHQIGSEFLKRMVKEAQSHGIQLPDRELACAPIQSETGQDYLDAMRAGINCALANREIITHLTRGAIAQLFPQAHLELLYDVSHNTCKLETHVVDGQQRQLFVHRKGATRALPPGHPDLPAGLKDAGQPVLIGGTMGTSSYVLAGMEGSDQRAFSSACHGAGRSMSRKKATKTWSGRDVQEGLAAKGILVRSPSKRGIAEEAPGAYKDVTEVVHSAEQAGLARRVARLEPLVCIKG
jgi:tRNA-splicing ligase RtcB